MRAGTRDVLFDIVVCDRQTGFITEIAVPVTIGVSTTA